MVVDIAVQFQVLSHITVLYVLFVVYVFFVFFVIALVVFGVAVVFRAGFFFFNQKPAYEMRISDWSSDVCSSDLAVAPARSVSMSMLETPPAPTGPAIEFGPLLLAKGVEGHHLFAVVGRRLGLAGRALRRVRFSRLGGSLLELQIGRASGRGRVRKCASFSVGAGT